MATTIGDRQTDSRIYGEGSVLLADTLIIQLKENEPIHTWVDSTGYCLAHSREVASAAFRAGLGPGGMYREDAVGIVVDWFDGLEDDSRLRLADTPHGVSRRMSKTPRGWVVRKERFNQHLMWSVAPAWA